MRSCSQRTVCPNCKHKFACCEKKSLVLSGGGLVQPSTVANVSPPIPSPSPKVSPSTPLTFGFPLPLQSLPLPVAANQDVELKQLRDTVRALRQSGWFYEGISFEDSHEMLKDSKVGTFLVRNSSNPRFLFSLSVQTDRGPTSVRLHYTHGYFRLDAQPHLQGIMPAFPNVVDLIQHYIREFKRYKENSSMQVWVDNEGKLYSSLIIQQPLLKREEPPSLKHISRLAIHKAIHSSGNPSITLLPPPYEKLELPSSLISYLGEYPHSI